MKTAKSDVKTLWGMCDDLKSAIDELGERLLDEIQSGIDLRTEIDRLEEIIRNTEDP